MPDNYYFKPDNKYFKYVTSYALNSTTSDTCAINKWYVLENKLDDMPSKVEDKMLDEELLKKKLDNFKREFFKLMEFKSTISIIGSDFISDKPYFKKFLDYSDLFKFTMTSKQFRKINTFKPMCRDYSAIMLIEPEKLFKNKFEFLSFILFLYRWRFEEGSFISIIMCVYLSDESKRFTIPKKLNINHKIRNLYFDINNENIELQYIYYE